MLREVEPLHLRIGNYGFRPVQLRYDGFRLVSERGLEYAPVLPVVHEADAGSNSQAVVTPRFSYSGFKIARYEGHVYSGLFVQAVSLFRDAPHARRWNTETFPMQEPLEWAIPEGILEVGGFVDGYMFFERVPPGDTRLRFEAVLTAPRVGPMKRADLAAPISAKSSPLEEAAGDERVARVSIPLEAD
ncbi:MAG TPA: hypothetical protein VJR89_05960 [Polyangiales bacterium]|nr:hypothetical protein [Polyangiales bacterium]